MTIFTTFRFVVLGLIVSALPCITHAAQLSLIPLDTAGHVAVMLDTEGVSVNTLEGTINLTNVQLDAFSFTDSIIPLWVQQPRPDARTFSAVIPGGYDGSNGLLFTMRLRGGPGTISINDSSAYLNDGIATPVSLTAPPLSLPRLMPQASPIDEMPPEITELVIDRHETIFDGDWFMTIHARDDDSGVAEIQIAEREGINTDQTGLVWRTVTSPARLDDQSRQSTIFVQIRDVAGNVMVTSTAPQAASSIWRGGSLGAVIVLILLLLGLGGMLGVIRRRVRRS